MTTELELLLGVLGVGALSMLAFALRGGPRDRDAERKGTVFAGRAGVFLVHWFLWVLGPLERLFLRWRVRPDVFNFVGLGLGALSGALIGLGHLKAGGWAIALGGACDIFDGRMARGLGVDSSYGKFIDSTLDRFVEVFVFLGFAVALRGFTWGPLVVTAAICGSLLVSYARARGESLGVLCKEGLMQRAERLALTCLACLSDPALTGHLGLRPGSVLLGTLLLIAVGTFVTAAHRTLWISRRLLERG